jgi:hypothetical protein
MIKEGILEHNERRERTKEKAKIWVNTTIEFSKICLE